MRARTLVGCATAVFVAGAFAMLSAEEIQMPSARGWVQTDETVALRDNGEILWQFNYGPDCTKPYFHPVAVPGVGTLTWKSPPDHPWHLALWFSWKYINGLNYWEEDRQTGKSEGLTSWHDVKVTTRDDGSARIEMDLDYRPPGEKPVLFEHRVMEVSTPDRRGQFHIDWTATFTAADGDVLLDRTPLPDEPGGKIFGGYAGLSVRFAKDFVDRRATDSDGQIDEQAQRIRVKARAVDYSGTIDGRPAGIAILDDPRNLNAPTPWYIIQSPAQPMAYFSPAVIQQKPHTLSAGQSMTLRYRVIVHPGRMDRDELDRQSKAYVDLIGANDARAEKPKRNILMIAVDDLRPELGCYGNEKIITPNFDRLADAGLVFERAYTQISICMPSRVSVLSGIRPENIGRSGRLTGHLPKGAVSLPGLFKSHGYDTISIGKVYHFNDDDEAGWTKRYTITFGEGSMCHGYASGYHLAKNLDVLPNYFKRLDPAKNLPRPDCYEIVDKPDSEYPDGRITAATIDELRSYGRSGKPFFLAAGYYRPHLPHTPPKRYWDIYDRDKLDLADNPYAVKGGIGTTDWNELRRYGDIPNSGPVSDEKARQLIHGYYASVSFIDAQIGRLLDELERLGLRDNTAIVLWGDHGWNLGEHGWWSKNTNYEVSTRTAMLASLPGVTTGRKTNALVELVDIYPTLCELADLPRAGYLEGTSFVPLLADPDRPWKRAATSVWVGSRTLRTDRYRLTRYDKSVSEPTHWQLPSSGVFELFDHQTDPDENVNVAERPQYREVLATLIEQMDAGHPAARPATAD